MFPCVIPNLVLREFELVKKVAWKCELGQNNKLITRQPKGARRRLVTISMDHWEAWSGFQVDPRLEVKSDSSPKGTC